MSFKQTAMLALVALSPMPASAARDPGALIGRSAFVGFIGAAPLVADMDTQGWQGIEVERVDRLMGITAPRTSEWLSARPGGEWPKAFPERGEYLIFLGPTDSRHRWPVLAAFPVDYAAEAGGRIVGRLPGRLGATAPTREAVAKLLRRASTPSRPGSIARARLARWLNSAATLGPAIPSTYEARLRWAHRKADGIRVGTRRSDVEKVFPQRDGGLSRFDRTRYYAGNEVMVEVPYDSTSGARKPSDRVTGPLRYSRSMMAID